MSKTRYQIEDTDKYDSTHDGQKQCKYCDAPIEQSKGSSTIGLCARHSGVWNEDVQFGLHKRNRLKEIILRSKIPTAS